MTKRTRPEVIPLLTTGGGGSSGAPTGWTEEAVSELLEKLDGRIRDRLVVNRFRVNVSGSVSNDVMLDNFLYKPIGQTLTITVPSGKYLMAVNSAADLVSFGVYRASEVITFSSSSETLYMEQTGSISNGARVLVQLYYVGSSGESEVAAQIQNIEMFNDRLGVTLTKRAIKISRFVD